MDNQSKYKIWEDKPFTCPACGKDSTLGLETKDISKAQELPGKVICIDCALEFAAKTRGIFLEDLVRQEEEAHGAYNLFMTAMTEKYFKENDKKTFDSAQEESHAREFFSCCWSHYPKWFLLVPALYGEAKTKSYVERVDFDFRELSSIIKNSYGGKIDRNVPCPCRSGKKYKKCCGK